ncbi:MAG: hypothetical protein WA857_09970 [Candidatus Acidiferrum sp.]
MAKAADAGMTRERAGLCADCRHARRVESSHGAIFLLCELSKSNSEFAKYPRLPVVSCAGYEKSAPKAELK